MSSLFNIALIDALYMLCFVMAILLFIIRVWFYIYICYTSFNRHICMATFCLDVLSFFLVSWFNQYYILQSIPFIQ